LTEKNLSITQFLFPPWLDLVPQTFPHTWKAYVPPFLAFGRRSGAVRRFIPLACGILQARRVLLTFPPPPPLSALVSFPNFLWFFFAGTGKNHESRFLLRLLLPPTTGKGDFVLTLIFQRLASVLRPNFQIDDPR